MMMMMTNMVLRAPILTLALASLFLKSRAVMAQYDVGANVRTAIVTTSTTTPSPSTVSIAQVIFYHETVPAAPSPAGSYDVDYYYAGCVNQLAAPTPTPTPTSAAITSVVGSQTPSASFDAGDTTLFVNQCGPTDSVACTQKTTYSYNLQKLSEITDSDIKTVTTLNGVSTTTVKFCIRHQMLSNSNAENGYKEADMTFTWDSNNGFQNTVITNENGPDSETVDVGDVSVQVVRCAAGAVGPDNVYQQGELIQLCVSASVTSSSAAVTIVKVNTLRFWIDNNLQGTNGIYDVGETTQVGIDSTGPVGTTTILPPGAGSPTPSPAVYCIENFSTGWSPQGTKGCALSTFLGPAFFGPNNQSVRYAGTVTIEFGDGNNRIRRELSLRGHYRSLALQVGDQFDKPYGDALMVAAANNDNNSSTCSCSGFFLFKIFCWIFRCLLGFN